MNEARVVERLTDLVGELAAVPSGVTDDADRIDAITALEKLKAATAAAQLKVVDEFANSQEAANRELGVEARVARRGVPEQVGLARKVAPATASKQVTQAAALLNDLPETYGLLARGDISEWVATIVVTQTSHLAAEDRRLVDKKLAPNLPGLSPRRAEGRTKALAYEVDPEGAAKRTANARKDRRVSLRPAPDTMAALSALLPCEQGVAAWASLHRHTNAQIAAGDTRTRQQIMADTLVERLTGQAVADAVSAEIGLIMNGSALFGDDEQPADLDDYGPIPADLVRDLVRRAAAQYEEPDDTSADNGPGTEPGGVAGAPTEDGTGVSANAATAKIWLRRLFTDPVHGIIIDCDPRRRRFDGILAKLIRYRDRACRDPYCDAPIRHADHIQPHSDGGPTTLSNGRGLCERGNYVRHMPGWKIENVDPDRHIVETTTPTGHTYRSQAPPATTGVGGSGAGP